MIVVYLGMDIKSEKLNLIKWLTEVEEPSIIESFIELKNKQQDDWWDHISVEEKEAIDMGLTQADREETIPYEEVKKKYDQWRLK